MFVTKKMGPGGAERNISMLANYFSEQYYKVFIVSMDGEDSHYHLHDNVSMIDVSNNKWKNGLIKKISEFYKTRKTINNIKPDIVIALPEEIGIYLSIFNLFTKTPLIVSERNDPKVMPWKKITRIIRKISYKFVNGFVFQTNEAQSFFNNKIRRRSIVIPNSIDLSSLPQRELKINSNIIVNVGRFTKQKNHKLLINSFSRINKEFPSTILKIFGKGPLEEEIRKQIKDLNLEEKVILEGISENLLFEIKNCGLFVLSSDFEGIPNALIEAMSLGIPSIATDVPSGGVSALINNNENGLVVKVGDVDGLYYAMKLLLTNKELYDKISKNSLKIKEILNIKNIGNLWINFLENIIRKGT